MNYKKLIVSSDNKLVLEDYNLNSSNSEILDLNKSLYDVASDEELQTFIKENAIDPNKIYLICVKEDFGSNDQRIENIPDVKPVYKVIKKKFKKFPNVFFFVYNTYMKNQAAINPEMETPSSLYPEEAEVVENEQLNQEFTQEEPQYTEEYPQENDAIIEENNVEMQEEPIVSFEEQQNEEKNIEEPVFEQNFVEPEEQVSTIEGFTNEPIFVSDDFENKEIIEEKPSDDINWEEIPIVETDENVDDILASNENIEVDATPVNVESNDSWTSLENTNVVFENEEMTSDQLSSPYDEDVSRFNDMNLSTDANNDVVNTDISIPESYFNEEDEEQISYEDYNEFQNDYELNVHALKSIYDFIWRMLVLNNYNLKLNDLLYLSVNNLDAFSIGQSDFVRQTANKSESLFDLILQLDIKLEFNNSLFYIYLAELFAIKANKIIVNQSFLNTLSIWVNKSSKDKFVSQVEQFVNYSTIYNKKIIFSYFIELSNFIKGCIPTISPTLNLIDIHRILTNPSKQVRKENIFGFMVNKMNEIFRQNGVLIESDIAETPDNMFSTSKDNYLDDIELNWKSKLSNLYKRLLENIRNYVLTKGNNETEIFNIYVDIKDLKMYRVDRFDQSSISSEVIDTLSDNSYLTIGDAFDRTPSIVPSQVSSIGFENQEPTSLYPQYSEPTYSTGAVEMENKYIDSSLVQPTKPTTRFNSLELEDSMTRRIEEYEKKIKDNIARIEAERKNLREKMEALKNL